jgi:hypothetical protein
VKATADDPRAVRRLAKTLVDHQSDAMLTMTATYQIAHNGTYALAAEVVSEATAVPSSTAVSG